MKIKKKFEQMINLIFQVFIRQKVDLRNDGRWYFLKIADIPSHTAAGRSRPHDHVQD